MAVKAPQHRSKVKAREAQICLPSQLQLIIIAQSAVRSETGVEQNRGSEVIWTKLDDNNKTSRTHHIGLLPLQQTQWIFDRLIKCGGLAEAQGDVMPNSSYMPINL